MAIAFRRKYKSPNPIAACKSGGFLVNMVVATTDPTAIVIAKSKLDNLEKDLNPAIRVKAISIIYIPMVEMRTIKTSVQVVVSHE